MNQKERITSGHFVSQEPQAREIAHSLLTLRELLEAERLSLQEEIGAVDKKIAAVDLLLDSDTGDRKPKTGSVRLDDVAESLGATLQETDAQDVDAEPVSGAATVQDIEHCQTQREAGYVIAEINGGHIDLKSAAPVIKAAGLSKGMLNTIVSSLHNFMSNSDDWNYTGPSAFELLTCREGAPESGSEPDSGDEDSPMSKVVQDNSMMAQILNETAA